MAEAQLLVDARAITHGTAGGRGIGNYTVGLLHGLNAIGVPVMALTDGAATGVLRTMGLSPITEIAPWSRRAVRTFIAGGGTDFVATGMFLPPLPFDPIPRAVTEAGLRVTAIAYDVIPMRYPDLYLRDDVAVRLAHLRSALARTVDTTAAISAFTARTTTEVLELDPTTVHLIGAGVGGAFTPPRSAVERARTVLAVTGPDPRKNTEGLLRAWAEIPVHVRNGRRLLVVAGGSRAQREGWRAQIERLRCHDVDLLGPVDEADLVRMMQQTQLAVQPSLDEGFGLPVLEAAACGAVSICSNTSAMPEVLDDPAATFDPLDPTDMASAIARSLCDDTHRQRLLAAGRRAVARWRWERVAADLVACLNRTVGLPQQPLRRRIAVVRPSGNDHLEAALAEMPRSEVVHFVDSTDRVSPVAASPDGDRWPAGMLGRGIPLHDFDDVVTVVKSGRVGPASRLALCGGTHVWLDVGMSSEPFRQARSIIAPTNVEVVSSHEGSSVPTLVLDDALAARRGAGFAGVLARWMDDVDVVSGSHVGVQR